MASIFKPRGKDKFVIVYTDESGQRRKQVGTTDKADRAYRCRSGGKGRLAHSWADRPGDESATETTRRLHCLPISALWQKSLIAKNYTAKHAEHTSNRVRRLVAVVLGESLDSFDTKRVRPADRAALSLKLGSAIAKARLSTLSQEDVEDALATLKESGLSLGTCNHYRAAARAFSRWAWKSKRTKEWNLRGLEGFNARADRRHDRRTMSVEELHKLIKVALTGRTIMGMTGEARALCYGLAALTGLRYAEIGSITPESFNWKAPNVVVQAAYTKNGETAVLPVPFDLVDALIAHVATVSARKARLSPASREGRENASL